MSATTNTNGTRLNPGFDYKPETWMDNAACAGYPTDWWFPTNDGVGGSESTETTQAAKAICEGCDVRLKCLDYTMRVESGFTRYGIFGGLNPDQRRKLDKAAS